MAIETELKYRIEDSFTVEKLFADPQILNAQREPFRRIQMQSIYYDTANGEASRRHWAMRLRMENEVPVATMKTPAVRSENSSLFTRSEWQTEAPSFQEAIPRLIELGAPAELAEVTSNSPLEERCRVLFTRRSVVLTLEGGVRVDLCIDQGEIQAGGKTEPIQELELELLFGPIAPVLELGTYLAETYSLQKEYVSKYERALRLIRSRR